MNTNRRKHKSSVSRLSFLLGLTLVLPFSSPSFGQGLLGNGGYDAPMFQADFYQDLTDFSSGLVNPALLYRVNQVHLDGGAYWWAIDKGLKSWGFWQVAGYYPIRRNHTAGLTVIQSISPDIPVKEIEQGTWVIRDPESGPMTTRYSDTWFVGHYGVRILPWLMAGTNVKLRLQNQFDSFTLSNWPSVDVGAYFNPIDHYRMGDLGFSLMFQDIVPSRIDWGTKTEDAVDSQGDTTTTVKYKTLATTRVRAGLRYSAFNDQAIFDIEYVMDDGLGFMWDWTVESADKIKTIDTTNVDTLFRSPFEDIAHRMAVHAKWQFIPQVWLKGGWNNNNIPYLGLNLNMMYPLPEWINFLSIDTHVGYSFWENIFGQKDERDVTFMLKVSGDVGPTREQRESKRLYDKLILAPMNAYNEAMKLYWAGKYWLASFAFGKVITLFPNFHLNDKATFYMGNSYRFLHMNDVAREVYEDGLEKFTTSDMRPNFMYGLMNLDYREENYEEALKNHAFIVNLYPESDIRSDADYLAGEIHFQRKNYHAAEQLFDKIEPGAPAYLYAQYTLSIINVENKKSQEAIRNLKTIVEDTTQDPAKLLLLDAANLKLGHLYFEEVELRKAVESYKRVTPGSAFGDEALLGMAWSWIKVNQASVALPVLDQLMASYPKSAFIPEAYLLKGYANMLMKRYPTAKNMLEQTVELCQADYITESDVQQRKQQFSIAEQEFEPTGNEILKNALRRPTDRVLAERDDLKQEYNQFAQENENFFNYMLLAKEHKKFLRQKEQILMDAEYALAKVVSLMGTERESQKMQKEKQKIESIDEEIERLRKELEEDGE